MLIASALAAVVATSTPVEPHYAEVLFMFDTSGSTIDYQRAFHGVALSFANSQLTRFGNGNVRVAMVQYGRPDKGILYRPFTANPSSIFAMLSSEWENSGQLETPTDIGKFMLDYMRWSSSDDVVRTIEIMGNESPEQGKVSALAFIDSVLQKKTHVNTVYAPTKDYPSSPDPWKDMADATGGLFVELSEQGNAYYTGIFNQCYQDLQNQRQLAAMGKYLNQVMERQVGRGH